MVQPPQNDPGQQEAPYEAASRSTAEFVQNVAPLQTHKQKARRGLWVAIAIVLLVGLAAGGWFIYAHPHTAKKTPQKTSHSENTSQSNNNTPGQYTSTDFNLSFKYPSGWQVDDSKHDILQVKSGIVKLPNEKRQQVDAKVVLNIIATNTKSSFPADSATAVRDSIKFTYDSPSEGQRQETYLSFVNLDGPSSGGLDAAYITGDSGYVKGDPITKADFDKVQPIFWLEFYSSSGNQKLAIMPSAWDSNTTLQAAFSILKSLNIK